MFCSFTARLLFLLPDFSDTFLLSPPPPILSRGLVNRINHVLYRIVEYEVAKVSGTDSFFSSHSKSSNRNMIEIARHDFLKLSFSFAVKSSLWISSLFQPFLALQGYLMWPEWWIVSLVLKYRCISYDKKFDAFPSVGKYLAVVNGGGKTVT